MKFDIFKSGKEPELHTKNAIQTFCRVIYYMLLSRFRETHVGHKEL